MISCAAYVWITTSVIIASLVFAFAIIAQAAWNAGRRFEARQAQENPAKENGEA